MWRTKDFEKVTQNLRRLRGTVPSGNLFERDETGRVKQIGHAGDDSAHAPPHWCPCPRNLELF